MPCTNSGGAHSLDGKGNLGRSTILNVLPLPSVKILISCLSDCVTNHDFSSVPLTPFMHCTHECDILAIPTELLAFGSESLNLSEFYFTTFNTLFQCFHVQFVTEFALSLLRCWASGPLSRLAQGVATHGSHWSKNCPRFQGHSSIQVQECHPIFW